MRPPKAKPATTNKKDAIRWEAVGPAKEAINIIERFLIDIGFTCMINTGNLSPLTKCQSISIICYCLRSIVHLPYMIYALHIVHYTFDQIKFTKLIFVYSNRRRSEFLHEKTFTSMHIYISSNAVIVRVRAEFEIRTAQYITYASRRFK